MAVLNLGHLNNLAFDIEHRLRDVHGLFPALTPRLLTNRPPRQSPDHQVREVIQLSDPKPDHQVCLSDCCSLAHGR